MEQFIISVLITFFNQEKYVDECLESVFSQKTTFPVKVIVGDDGSTDGTIEKIREWQRKYPEKLSLFQMPREQGKKYVAGTRASHNRLALLEKVDTKYFHYLDGDDYWTDENKLQIEYDILEKTENKECVGCAHSLSVFRENDLSKKTQCWGDEINEGKYSLERYWKNMYFSTDTILFRSENISKLPRQMIEDVFNDNIITFCFMQFGPIYFVDKCMAAYRQNDNGIWVGERRAVGIIRELIAYDIELKINPMLKGISTRRHIVDFVYVHHHGEEIKGMEMYYEIAEKYQLPVTKKVISSKRVFFDNYILDGCCIWLLRIVGLLLKIKERYSFRKRNE